MVNGNASTSSMTTVCWGQTVDAQTIQIRILQEEGITQNIEYICPLLPAYVQNR